MGSISSISIGVFLVVSLVIVGLLTAFQKNRPEEPIRKQSSLVFGPNGNNASLRVALKGAPEMRNVGFAETQDGKWAYQKSIGEDSIFHLEVDKVNPANFRISVSTGAPERPFDFQKVLLGHPTDPKALSVRTGVEGEMKYLSDQGIVRGHRYGEYI